MLGTEEPSMLQSMGLQRVKHNLVTEQQNQNVLRDRRNFQDTPRTYTHPLILHWEKSSAYKGR